MDAEEEGAAAERLASAKGREGGEMSSSSKQGSPIGKGMLLVATDHPLSVLAKGGQTSEPVKKQRKKRTPLKPKPAAPPPLPTKSLFDVFRQQQAEITVHVWFTIQQPALLSETG
jgi:hypothetical protein